MNHENITAPILAAHPDTQAIYFFGTWGTEYQRPDSDLDIAVLLPNTAERRVDFWEWCRLSAAVASAAKVGRADLINLRDVDTSFQAEILNSGRLIHCAEENERIRFEVIVLSKHQKLNQERAGIREEIISSGRVYAQ